MLPSVLARASFASSGITISSQPITNLISSSADAKMGWEAGTLTKEEFEEFFNVEFTDFTTMMKDQYAKVIDELNKVFADNFTKEKGVYVGNKDTDYEGTTIKITAKEMCSSFPTHFSISASFVAKIYIDFFAIHYHIRNLIFFALIIKDWNEVLTIIFEGYTQTQILIFIIILTLLIYW